ncbi:MAG: hypothetical protein RL291_2130, partial [Pseudomonadota bacterium]
ALLLSFIPVIGLYLVAAALAAIWYQYWNRD